MLAVVERDDLRVKGTGLLDLVFALLAGLGLWRILSLGGGHDLARLERTQRLALGPERDSDEAFGAGDEPSCRDVLPPRRRLFDHPLVDEG